MYNHVLLISRDLGLAARLSKILALPPLAGRLTRLAPGTELATADAAPLLIVWDDREIAAPVPAAVERARSLAIPVVRLSAEGGEIGRGDVVDTVAGSAGLSKLVYVVRQRLAAAHWRRTRQRQASLGTGHGDDALAISNVLSSLLGNAELALQQMSHRLPEDGRQRLENVVSLSLALRDLLAEPGEGRAA